MMGSYFCIHFYFLVCYMPPTKALQTSRGDLIPLPTQDHQVQKLFFFMCMYFVANLSDGKLLLHPFSFFPPVTGRPLNYSANFAA
jgi:hypothetical protein